MYVYVLLKNNVVIKEKVHEDDRTTANTALLIYYAKLNASILRIHLGQKEHQRSITDFWDCKSGNQKVT